jgi:hypothetical protein
MLLVLEAGLLLQDDIRSWNVWGGNEAARFGIFLLNTEISLQNVPLHSQKNDPDSTVILRYHSKIFLHSMRFDKLNLFKVRWQNPKMCEPHPFCQSDELEALGQKG